MKHDPLLSQVSQLSSLRKGPLMDRCAASLQGIRFPKSAGTSVRCPTHGKKPSMHQLLSYQMVTISIRWWAGSTVPALINYLCWDNAGKMMRIDDDSIIFRCHMYCFAVFTFNFCADSFWRCRIGRALGIIFYLLHMEAGTHALRQCLSAKGIKTNNPCRF